MACFINTMFHTKMDWHVSKSIYLEALLRRFERYLVISLMYSEPEGR